MKTIGNSAVSRLAVLCFLAAPALAQPSRIRGPIDPARTVVLHGSRNPRVAGASDEGALPPGTLVSFMRITLKPTAAQTAALEKLLEEQRDPASPQYRQFLTPEQFGEQFGASAEDAATVAQWLESEGFTVEQTARARNWIAFSGTAAQVAKTFHAELHRRRANGETHFANVADPSVPEALADLAGEIRGLDDFHLRPPRLTKIAPAYTASNGAHYLAPDDLAAIYDIAPLYQAGYDGTGQKLAIVGQTDINLADIRGFRSQFGLPAKDPQLVLDGPDPGVSSGDQVESDLDLEWSGAVARNAAVLFVYSQDVYQSLEYVIDQNLAPVVSMSYGGCELGVSSSNRLVAQQANAEGITWLNSSGDSGAAGCDWGGPSAAQYGLAVTFPADIPEVTAVGGTEFNESGSTGWGSSNSSTWASATGYLPEKGWNDTALGGGIWASSGGVSVVFPKPSWQTGPGVPNDGARDVPDVSLAASGDHDGYLVYVSGGLYSVGGTSASSPSFAGIVTLLNHYLTAKAIQAKPGLGNINPTLYTLAQNSAGAIHDITVGNNIVPCVAKSTGCSTGSFGYSAGAGYDMVTGVGSVDAYNLVTKWNGVAPITGTKTTLAANPSTIAATASTQLSATVAAVSGSNPPAGSVTFTLGNTTLGSAALAASGTSAAASLTVKGSSLAAGTNAITATYTSSGAFGSSSSGVTVTVTGAAISTKTAVTATPSSVASTGTVQLAATVTASSGSAAPSGSVTFLAGTATLGAATLSSSGTAALSVSASKLSLGNNSITASYAGATNFSPSVSAAVTVAVTSPLTPTTIAFTANPASIAQSASTTLTVTVKASSGTTSPTGTATFAAASAANGASLGTATLSGSGGTATATFTLKGTALPVGNTAVAATYGGDSKCAASTATIIVTVTAASVSTTTTVAANPPTVAQNSSTTVTALVKASSGSAVPTGTIVFAIGSASLGTAQLSPSTGGAAAALSVPGSKLATGNNNIVAAYSGATGFAASSATVLVVVTAPTVATTTTVTASAASIAQTASTQVTATIKGPAGSAAPAGTVAFSLGSVSLGSAALTASGSSSIATLTVKGSSLAAGNNTITASYSGNGSFASSSGSTTVSVSVTSLASNVVATAVKTTSTQSGFPVKVQLQETAGVATTLTGMTINGTNFTSAIAPFFGTTQLSAHGTLTGTMIVQWSPLPSTLTFLFTGVDASGRQWSQTVSLATH